MASNVGGRESRVVGLALSGGGVRSASFSFGVLQYLARFLEAWLARPDEPQEGPRRKLVLSTVSGGGWSGSSAVFALRAPLRTLLGRVEAARAVRLAQAIDRGSAARAAALADSFSRSLEHKRRSWTAACAEASGALEIPSLEEDWRLALEQLEERARERAAARDRSTDSPSDNRARKIADDRTLEKIREAAAKWGAIEPYARALKLEGPARAAGLRAAAGWSPDAVLGTALARARANASYLTPSEGHGGVTSGTSLGALLASYAAGLLVNLLELTGITSVLGCAVVAILYAFQAPTMAFSARPFGGPALSGHGSVGEVVHGGGSDTLLAALDVSDAFLITTYVVQVEGAEPFDLGSGAMKCQLDTCYLQLGTLEEALAGHMEVPESGLRPEDIDLYACGSVQQVGGGSSPTCLPIFFDVPPHPTAAWEQPSSVLYFLCAAVLGLLVLIAIGWDRALGLRYGNRWIFGAVGLVLTPPIACALSLHQTFTSAEGVRLLGAVAGALAASGFVLGGARASAQRRSAQGGGWLGVVLAAVGTLLLGFFAYLDRTEVCAQARAWVAAQLEASDTAALTIAVCAFPAFWIQFAVMSPWAMWLSRTGPRPDAEDRDRGRSAMVWLMVGLVVWCVLIIDTTAAVHLTGELVIASLLSMDTPQGVPGQIFAVLLVAAIALAIVTALPRPTGASRARAAALSLFGVLSFAFLLDVQSAILGQLALAFEALRHGPVLLEGRPSRLAAMDAACVGLVGGTFAVLISSIVRKVLTRGLLTPHYVYRDRIRQVFVGESSCTLAEVTSSPARFEWVLGAVSNAPEGPRRYELGTARSGEEPAPGMATQRPWLPKGNPLGNTPVEKALAVSAAAISPLMGVYGDRWIWWLASLLNLRLGARLPDATATGADAGEEAKRIPLLPVPVSAVAGQVYVTDGGHLDNSGLDALIRRRCDFMIVVDGEQDGPGTYAGLAQAVRLARLDGVDVEIDLTDTTPGADGYARSPCAVGRVRYPAEDGRPPREATLLYIKPTVSVHEPVEVRNYRLRNPAFPHEPTSNQFFDAEQFDAYRQLGHWSAERAFLPVTTRWNGVSQCAEPIDPFQLLAQPLARTFAGLHSAWRIAKASDLPTFLGLTNGWMARIDTRLPPHEALAAEGKVSAVSEALAAFDEPTLRAELQKLQHMEQVFEACRLWQTVHFTDNAGWLQLFWLYWESPSFRAVWAAYRAFFSQDFCHFAERVLDYKSDRASV